MLQFLTVATSFFLQGFEKCAQLFEELDLEGTRARTRSLRPDLSGKLLLLARQVHRGARDPVLYVMVLCREQASSFYHAV